jgi:hypothetical protein
VISICYINQLFFYRTRSKSSGFRFMLSQLWYKICAIFNFFLSYIEVFLFSNIKTDYLDFKFSLTLILFIWSEGREGKK